MPPTFPKTPQDPRPISGFFRNVAVAVLLCAAPLHAEGPAGVNQLLAAQNVVWDSPSADMHGSMPIGNGDLAANFWVEPNGDLVFYLSKSDSWNENQDLLKLGRVRIRLDEPFVKPGARFRQELDLPHGRIVATSGEGNAKTTVEFWIDANRPVAHVQIEGGRPFGAEVFLETWRNDMVLPAEANTIRWYHRNTRSIFRGTLDNQHLGHLAAKFPDPLLDLTFGGMIAGEGLVSKDGKTLATAGPVGSLDIRIHALTAQTPTAGDWLTQLENLRRANDSVSASKARAEHESWWREFWDRSWIFPNGTPEADKVARAYTLQRWIQACAGRGGYPIKFNGSLFTVDGITQKDGKTNEHGPDWRQWGGGYWFQNTREPYWSMLYAGDYDLMEPLWRMYRAAVPLLKERTKTYFNHGGIYYSESMHPWGLNMNYDFGIGNKGFLPKNPYMRYNWDAGLELSLMMLDTYAHTGNETFARETILPVADGVVAFYDQHYKRTPEGKVLISPSMSLETWHTAADPLPVIAGLQAVLDRLLELPDSLSSADQRDRWGRFRAVLPGIPLGQEKSTRWILPARTYSESKNSENPELYAVFPYRLFGAGKPDFETALETWKRRRFKETGGWRQDAIQAAMLGLTGEAKFYVVKNSTNPFPIGAKPVKPPRFPAFWGPNFDWLPDQCHGSVNMIALQKMVLQCEGDSIRLLPAWPKDWNANFKLHAPKNTTLEGRVEGGKLVDLKVTPEARKKDIVHCTLPGPL